MVPFWLALPVGILIATLVTIVGFGGGILWVPFLLIALNIPPASALMTSLLIQVAGTASGSIAFIRNKKVDIRLAFLLLAMGLPSLILGSYIGCHLTLSHIGLFIGLISLTTALLFVSSNHKYGEEGDERVNLRAAFKHSWIACVTAIMCGMLTINIGEWLVPIMQKKMRLKMSNSIATCVMVTCGMSILAAASHFVMKTRPNLTAAAWGVPGVLIGGQIGPRLLNKIDDRQLKEVFIFLLTLIGIHLVYRSIL
ncbi:MAG: sulfite exporter TauE/SafE family protein [Syntrophobacteraceae bacterium]